MSFSFFYLWNTIGYIVWYWTHLKRKKKKRKFKSLVVLIVWYRSTFYIMFVILLSVCKQKSSVFICISEELIGPDLYAYHKVLLASSDFLGGAPVACIQYVCAVCLYCINIFWWMREDQNIVNKGSVNWYRTVCRILCFLSISRLFLKSLSPIAILHSKAVTCLVSRHSYSFLALKFLKRVDFYRTCRFCGWGF